MRSNNLSDDPEVHRCLVNRVTTDVRNIDRGEKKRNKILHVFFFIIFPLAVSHEGLVLYVTMSRRSLLTYSSVRLVILKQRVLYLYNMR